MTGKIYAKHAWRYAQHNLGVASVTAWGRRRWLRQVTAGLLGLAPAIEQLAGGRLAHAQGASPGLRVAAASNLQGVFDTLVQAFQGQTGLAVNVVYGASGNLARQIQQGLPVDLFLAADEASVELLWQAGLTRRLPQGGADPGVVYALGRLALLVHPTLDLALDAQLQGLRSGWPQVQKFAIANPEHAPYGRAAREALGAVGLWPSLQPRIVLGENIAQATQYVVTGAAQAGMTALALARLPEVQRQTRHTPLSEHLHAPIRQRMVLLRHAAPAAQALHDYLLTDAARALLLGAGYGLPQPQPRHPAA